jgi:hypothetical protein
VSLVKAQLEYARKKLLLSVLSELGGEATTREIAEKAKLDVELVATILATTYMRITCLGDKEKKGEVRWKLDELPK